jgi:CheY-like chemotaxis protein
MTRADGIPALVLLINGAPDLVGALAYGLRSEGYDVTIERDAKTALARLRGGLTPCVILLDLDPARKTGLAFRQEQLTDPRIAGIPAAAYSSSVQLRPHAEALGLAFFEKALDEGPLLEFVALHCRGPALP